MAELRVHVPLTTVLSISDFPKHRIYHSAREPPENINAVCPRNMDIWYLDHHLSFADYRHMEVAGICKYERGPRGQPWNSIVSSFRTSGVQI